MHRPLRLLPLAIPVLCLAVWAAWPVPVVVVRNESRGASIVHLPASDGAPLSLRYVHSIYRQPGTEQFIVRPAGLELVRLISPSVSVLEYYARPEPITAVASGFQVDVRPERYAKLTLLVGDVGQRTVILGEREFPLHRLASNGDRISLAIRSAPRIVTLWLDRT